MLRHLASLALLAVLAVTTAVGAEKSSQTLPTTPLAWKVKLDGMGLKECSAGKFLVTNWKSISAYDLSKKKLVWTFDLPEGETYWWAKICGGKVCLQANAETGRDGKKSTFHFIGLENGKLIKSMLLPDPIPLRPYVAKGRIYYASLNRTLYTIDPEKQAIVNKLALESEADFSRGVWFRHGESVLLVRVVEEFLAVDMNTNAVLWKKPSWRICPRSPLCGDHLAFVRRLKDSKDYEVVGMNLRTGEIEWTHEEVPVRGGFFAGVGSVVVSLCKEDKEKVSRIVGIEASTGKTLWGWQPKEQPCRIDMGTENGKLFTLTWHAFYRLDPKSGSVLWRSAPIKSGNYAALAEGGLVRGWGGRRTPEGKFVNNYLVLDQKDGKLLAYIEYPDGGGVMNPVRIGEYLVDRLKRPNQEIHFYKLPSMSEHQ